MQSTFKKTGILIAGVLAATLTLHSTGATFAKPAHKKPAAKNSAAPTVQIISQKLRETWEKKADPGSDGAQTVIIHSIQIGSPRPWTILDGNGGKPGRKVWPAKVHWTLRTHYRTRTVVLDRHWIVSCFKNGFNEWVVQDSGESGQTETRSEEPTTMK